VSIQVVPRRVLDDQQAVRPKDAVRNVSGVQDAFGWGALRDRLIVRGFEIVDFPQGGSYVDGLLQFDSINSLANVENVEVLKGASAMLFGRMQPGGLVNYVTKRPQRQRAHSVQQQFGSFGQYRTTLDTTGQLRGDGSLMYRANAEFIEADSFRDFVNSNRVFVAPSLTWKPSARTQFDVDVSYQDDETLNDYGIPAFGSGVAPIPRTRYLGESFNRSTTTTDQESVGMTHRFTDQWRLKAKVSRFAQNGLFDETVVEFVDETTGIADRWLYDAPYTADASYGVADLTGALTTGRIKHTMLFGVDRYGRTYTEDGIFVDPFSTATGLFPSPIDIFNPVYGYDKAAVLEGQPRASFQTKDSWWGVYAQDQVSLSDQWHVMIGGRFDHAVAQQSRNPERTTDVETVDNRFSSRLGVLFHPTPDIGLFANYTRAFGGPNIGVSAEDGSALPSRTSSQMEGGVKTQWLQGRITASAVIFQLTQANIAQPISPVPGSPSDVSGEARSRGLELDLLGRFGSDVDVVASYTRSDGEFTIDANNQGNGLPNVAPHMGSLWLQYRLDSAGLPGASVGGGIFSIGDRPGDNANSFVLPGYARVDVAATYRARVGRSALVFQVNVENLLDEEYFAAANGRTYLVRISNTPGTPRSVMGSIRFEF
jgi:iron complex outermembrane receptor protein